jgi:DnaK suppressor protein
MKNYSPKELSDFRLILVRKLEDTTLQYQETLNRLNELREIGTRDTDSLRLNDDDAGDIAEREELNYEAGRLKKYLDSLSAALLRVENGTYGICKITGNRIPRERLMAVPHTSVSIEAKLGK